MATSVLHFCIHSESYECNIYDKQSILRNEHYTMKEGRREWKVEFFDIKCGAGEKLCITQRHELQKRINSKHLAHISLKSYSSEYLFYSIMVYVIYETDKTFTSR